MRMASQTAFSMLSFSPCGTWHASAKPCLQRPCLTRNRCPRLTGESLLHCKTFSRPLPMYACPVLLQLHDTTSTQNLCVVLVVWQ